MAHHAVPGSEIKDLKVIDMPKDSSKKKKSTKNEKKSNKDNNNYDNSTNSTPVQQPLQDDAILFYRSNTPSRETESRSNGGNKKITQEKHL